MGFDDLDLSVIQIVSSRSGIRIRLIDTTSFGRWRWRWYLWSRLQVLLLTPLAVTIAVDAVASVSFPNSSVLLVTSDPRIKLLNYST